jgi:hypothetical protein
MNNYFKDRRKNYEKKFLNWMSGKENPSFLDKISMAPPYGLMYNTGKPLKDQNKIKELKKFKSDMEGLADKKFINKYL